MPLQPPFQNPTPAPLMPRRKALRLIAGTVGTMLAVACGGGGGGSTDATDSSGSATSGSGNGGSSTGGGSGACSEIPDETNGPFPADGSQSGVVNVLADSRVLRQDIRSDFGGSNTQSGVPMELTIALVDVGASCAPLAGAAVYIWHCNADGEYSVYSGAMNGGNHAGTTWLRGAQISDANGQVTFTTVYPGRYNGRATHIHVEVYADSGFKTLLKISQFAFDDGLNDTVYTASAYSDSAATQQTDNDRDNVFSDGYDDELLTISGSNNAGYVGTITMGVVAS